MELKRCWLCGGQNVKLWGKTEKASRKLGLLTNCHRTFCRVPYLPLKEELQFEERIWDMNDNEIGVEVFSYSKFASYKK